MMVSCDTGIVTWYSLGASGYGAMVMVELIKFHQSCFPAPMLEVWSAKCCQHVVDIGYPAASLWCPPCCLLLYRLEAVDQLDVVWVPVRACIFQDWCDNCLVLVGHAFY